MKWWVWWESTILRIDWELYPTQSRANEAERRAETLFDRFHDTLRKQMNGWQEV